VVLTLIAEVLSGETLVTPGGCVDMATATGMETFTWDGWLDQLADPPQALDGAEVETAVVDTPR
jgi:hypothetical protein